MKRKILKIFKRMIISILIIIGIFTLAFYLFVNFYPSFGGDVDKDREERYKTSQQYTEGKFVNEKAGVPKDFSFSEMLTMSKKFFFETIENGRPEVDPQMLRVDSLQLVKKNKEPRFVWFGHSAFLLQLENKNILIDPMFGKVPAPHPWLGAKRFNKELSIAIEKLPKIDAVVISHDHYDHLDYESIVLLEEKVSLYFVPLGVGVHLEAWGISKDAIVEMDWWDTYAYDTIELTCTPAQHFSGRKFSNGQSTLWSSWVIKTNETNLYFSGDSGYGSHFKAIGEKLGPFDLAWLECGQYNKMWPDIHMFPEQTAQAGVDLQAKTIMPIHWGAFKLAMHSWTDPVTRVCEKAKELNIPIITPMIGELTTIPIETERYQLQDWWK